mmetsp:Transcript_2088/g.4726  ORF Transcript_2088/g.4726 Transcript_2088/m.4726 type:complete len:226 (-) Transcript_2088:132-809(-)
MGLHPLVDLGQPLVLLACVVPRTHVDEVDDGLGGDEVAHVVLDELNLAVAPLPVPDGLVVIQEGLNLLVGAVEQRGELHLGVLLHILYFIRLRLQHELHVLLAQLRLDRLQITDRVYAVVHMHNVIVVKGTHHVEDSIHSGDVGQEGVPQARPLCCPLDQPRNVHDVQEGRVLAGGVPEVAQPVVALIRHRAAPLIGVNGAEGVVLRRDGLLCKQVEQRRLAHIG